MDDYLLQVLNQSGTLSALEVDGLTNWWAAERMPEESLGAFLERKVVFVPGSQKTLALMSRGYVSFPDDTHLYAPQGVERARSRCRPPDKHESRQLGGSTSESATQSYLGAVETFDETSLRTQAFDVAPIASSRPVPKPSPATFEIGSVVGKCLLTELIGQGGGGLVFRALHQGLNIPVAVKVLQRDSAALDSRVYQRLKSEARLLARLTHPSIVRVLDFEDDAVSPYIVLEYVEGFSLADLIQQSGSIRPQRVLRLITQIAEGLAAAWKLGIVHRDVKPANILLTRDGVAKLADLGLAVVVEGGMPLQSLGVTPLRDEAAGTVAYMSPEHFSPTGSIDHRADIYSLGATFYHAVTGRIPFSGDTPLEVMLKHAHEQPQPPHQEVPDLPPAFSAVILKMMAKAPEHRYSSYEDLLDALATLARDVPLASAVSPSSESFSGKRSSLWKSLLSGFGRTVSLTAKEVDGPRTS